MRIYAGSAVVELCDETVMFRVLKEERFIRLEICQMDEGSRLAIQMQPSQADCLEAAFKDVDREYEKDATLIIGQWFGSTGGTDEDTGDTGVSEVQEQ